MNSSDKTFLVTIAVLVVLAIAMTAYIFLIQKDYDFAIEAPCDPAEGTCFHRDCSSGECPPNELENYRMFSVPANDFSKCSDSSCIRECEQGLIPCVETVCGESEEDECAESP